MTSLKKRLDNVLRELEIIRLGLNAPGQHPTCCLRVYGDNKVSCDSTGPLPEEHFIEECKRCQERMRTMLSRVNLNDDDQD